MQVIVLLLSLIFSSHVCGYGLPSVNLGASNILDGGPLRPKPGWYWQEYLQYYDSSHFLNAQGHTLGNQPSPTFKRTALITQFFYQANFEDPLHGMPGITFTLPALLSSHVSKNNLGFSDSGNGFGNFVLGLYSQWKTIMHHERPVFVHRLEMDMFFPTGKNDAPCKTINPGTRFFYLDPYWAATLYLTPRIATSWRLHYLWCAKDKKTHFKAGQAVHLNFDTAFQFTKNFWAGLGGYYLKQVTDNQLYCKKVPNSREQVLGLGPGFAYFLPYDFIFFSYLYFETAVRNRPRAFNFIARLFKYF